MNNSESFLTPNSYQKVTNFLAIIFANSNILEVGKKDKKFCGYFSQLLSILKYFEDNCNFSEKNFFFQIELLLTNIFDQNINLQKYQLGTVKDYFVNLTIKTLTNYCINILNIERKVLLEDAKVSLETAINLLKNKVSNIKLQNSKTVSKDGEVVSERAKKFPEHQTIPQKNSANDSSHPRPTTSPFGPLSRPNPKDFADFYPFSSKPKIILSIKKWIGILSIILTGLSLIFVGFILLSDFGTYCFNFTKDQKIGPIDKYQDFTQSFVSGVIFFTGIILFRGLYNFLFLPRSDALKYRFPVWTSILFFFILFVNFTSFFFLYKPLVGNSPYFQNLLPSFKYTIIVIASFILIIHVAIFALSIVAILNNPKPDLQAIREKMESMKNNESNKNSNITC